MPAASQPADASGQVRTIQIISAALVAGVLMFLLIVLLVLRSGKLFDANLWDLSSPLTAVSIIMAATTLPLAFVLPAMLTRKALGDGPGFREVASEVPGFEGWGAHAPRLLALFQTQQIVRLALLEGTAFLATIAYMLEGKAPALILAVGLVLLMVACFPAESRIRAWMDGLRGVTTS